METSDDRAVLAANDAFYRAFAERDVDAMDEIWARRTAVVCIHPGWELLAGREVVMQSWQAIMSNPDSPAIECREAAVHNYGDVAFVICYEAVGSSVLVATNIFAMEDGAWKMVHHQAAGTRAALTTPSQDREPTLH